MCRYVERSDIKVDKEIGAELVLKTYDLFNLERPKKIVWCKDIFAKRFVEASDSAWSAWSAWGAGSAWSARSAWGAGSARSARSAGSAGSALDYEFDWFVIEHEYCLNPDKEFAPNENDTKYLQYSELLIMALEAGVGFRVEFEDVLYLVPCAGVRLNSNNLHHSDNFPAIEWKDGAKFYYLNGVNFKEDLWREVVSGKMPFGEILEIPDIDMRTQAMRYGNVEKFLEYVEAKTLDTYQKFLPNGESINYSLYEIPRGTKSPFTETAYYMRYQCPSTGKDYMSGVYKPMRTQDLTVPHMMSWKFECDEDAWKTLVPLVTES